MAGRTLETLAWTGVATGAIGVVSEILRPVLGWAYSPYGLLLLVWLAWTAVALWRLSVRLRHDHTATTRTPKTAERPPFEGTKVPPH